MSDASTSTSALDKAAIQARASEYHKQGFNCSQAVLCALAPELGCDVDTAFKLMEGFGLGMGNMSQTCGAVSGAVAAVGMAHSAGAQTPTTKRETYQLSRAVVERFQEQNSSSICRELKGVGCEHGMLRSCPGCIEDAAGIAVDIINGLHAER